MKRTSKLLKLKQETIRNLDRVQLQRINGAGSVRIPWNCYASDVPWDCNTISSLCTVP